MSKSFFKSLQDEEMQQHVLNMLEIENQIIILLSSDLRVSSLTDAAQRILHTGVLQPVQESLSENTCQTLRLCAREHCGAQLRETIDGIGYRVGVCAVEEGLLLHFVSRQELGGTTALSQLVTRRTNTYITTILALTTQFGKCNAESYTELQARIYKNTLRILRTQMHAALLESIQHDYEPEMQVQDAAELCREMIGKLPQTHVQVQLQVPEHCFVVFDRKLMQQALGNLLTNAIIVAEHTVTLALWRSGKRVTFGITDDGSGITAAELETMCNGWRYVQTDEQWSDMVAQNRSWGIGLPLAEYIAGLHSGVLLSHLNEPQGTRILLSMPDDLEALHFMRQPTLTAETGIDILETEFSVL